MAVGDGVGEGVGPRVAGVRRVGDHAIDQLDHAVGVGAHGHGGDGQHIAVDVGVIGQQGRDRDREDAPARDRGGVRIDDRRIVHRRDGQAHGPGVGGELAIVSQEGEAVGAVVVGDRRVQIGAVLVEGQRPVLGPGEPGVGQDRIVHIGGHGLAADAGVFRSGC